MLVVVVWYLHLVPVAVLDLQYFSVLIFWGKMPAKSYTFFFQVCRYLGREGIWCLEAFHTPKAFLLAMERGPAMHKGGEPLIQVSGSLCR